MIKRGRWYDKLSVYIYAWDAGTEQGDDFAFNNAPSSPLEDIKPFTADGSSPLFVSLDENQNKRVLPVGILTFTRTAADSDCVVTSEESKPQTFRIRMRSENVEVTCAWIGNCITRCNRNTLNNGGSIGPKVSEFRPITCGN
ncbi:hypothetical protein ACHAWO_007092 [Cyclotella atomus]|uniref:Spondin domain-containing protein n=1 Tax=Cyclotella atomus TaxID=382360 RepID=A0ABD3QLP3_9STRA